MKGNLLRMAIAMAGIGNPFVRNPAVVQPVRGLMPKRGVRRVTSHSRAGRGVMTGYMSKKQFGGRSTGIAKARRAAKKRNNIRKHK